MDMIEILGILNGGTAEESKQLAFIKKKHLLPLIFDLIHSFPDIPLPSLLTVG